MSDLMMRTALSWLLTYALHSTIFLLAALIVARRFTTSAPVRDFTWKLALVGGLVTATAQVASGVHPAGSFALSRNAPPAAAASRRAKDAPVGITAGRGATAAAETPVELEAFDAPAASAPPVPPGPQATTRDIAWWAVLAWALVAFALAAAYLARRLMLAGRLTVRRSLTDGPMPSMLDALRRAYGHRAAVRLSAASTISSPVAFGLGEICVPEAALTDLDEEQQRGLLAHELAHLARRDPLWLDAASLVERVFFFQPLNRVARAELQRNAEYICDDWAAQHHGSGEPLARCLARVAEWIEAAPLGVPVAGMAEQRSLLVTRISRLLEGNTVKLRLSRMTQVVTAVVVVAVVVAAAPGVQRVIPDAQGARGTPGGGATDGVLAGVSRVTGVGPVSVEVPSIVLTTNGRAVVADSAVVQALIERLKDKDAGVRAAAAQSLGNLRARRAVPALLELVTDADREVRGKVAEALGELQDERAIASLTKLLSDESPEVRERALNGLGEFEHDVPVSAILPILADPRAEVRGRAAELLGRSGDRAASAPLQKLLKDSHADVRRAAIEALINLKDASAAGTVRGFLSDDEASVRMTSMRYLREMRVPVGDEVILKAMGDVSAEARETAIEWAHEQQSPAFIAPLRKLLDDDAPSVREAAVDALSEIRGTAARDALRAALNSKDAKVRRAAAAALGDRP